MEELIRDFLKEFPDVSVEVISTGELFPENGKREGYPYRTKNLIVWSERENPALQLHAELLSERYENMVLRKIVKTLGNTYFLSFREIHSKASIALFSSIVHKINNKLTPILAYAQMLLKKNPEKSIEKIFHNAREISEVLNRTLDLFSLRRGECLNVEDVSTILARTIPGDYERTDSYGNPVLLGLVFEELRKNGEKKGEVKASCTVKGDHVIIKIKNPGHITEEIERKAFEPFFTTEKGEGLGLNLVHGIISKMYGGTVELKNEGDSTVVEIRLPKKKRDSFKMEDRAAQELIEKLLNLKFSP